MSFEPTPAAAGRSVTHAPYLRSAALRLPHGFFGRQGGVSVGIYASLNSGSGSGDEPSAVAENRRRIAAAMDVPPERLLGVHQVHSATAVRIRAPWTDERPQADAMVTTATGLALSVLTADCAPVLLADPGAGVIGAAHAGWRGALAGVLEATIELMVDAGARPDGIAAVIGPCIHQPSYQVGPEFEARFTSVDPANTLFFAPGPGDRRLFDLPGFAGERLRRCGLTLIETVASDTCADALRFFSNRRSQLQGEKDYGRNCSAIVLPF